MSVVIPTVVCPDCGERISVFAEVEHDLTCPGPMRLVFTDGGTYAEPVE